MRMPQVPGNETKGDNMKPDMEAVFDEWLRQWQHDPEAFAALEDEFTEAQGPSRKNESYGVCCARTFRRIGLELLAE
jgi:hypothetical protein